MIYSGVAGCAIVPLLNTSKKVCLVLVNGNVVDREGVILNSHDVITIGKHTEIEFEREIDLRGMILREKKELAAKVCQ